MNLNSPLIPIVLLVVVFFLLGFRVASWWIWFAAAVLLVGWLAILVIRSRTR